MSKIVVTGASGFVGSHTLLPLVEKGYEVHALYNTKFGTSISPEFRGKNINWRHCDLLDYGQTGEVIADINPDYLLHLAWDVKPGYRNSLENIIWMNASLNLFHQFAKCSNAKKIVASGSGFEYGIERPSGGKEEAINMAPDTLYGVCKNSLYTITKYLKLSVEFAWGRIFYVYGPREYPNRLIPIMIKGLLNNDEQVAVKGMPGQSYIFMYVEDVARAFVHAIQHDTIGDFNICMTEPIFTDELFDLIAALIDNSKTKLVYGSEFNMPLQAESKKLGLTGYRPKISIERGLTRTINWWRKELNK